MSVITWRTLNGGSPVEALGALNSAENSFSNGFGGVRDSLKQFQATDAANWQQTKLNNTNDFMAQLRAIDTPEKMAEAQKSGLLDALRSGYGAQVDANTIGVAQDGRMGILQDRAIRAGEFQDATKKRLEAPLRDQAQLLYASGDKAGGDAFVAAHPELTDRSGLKVFGNTQDRQFTTDKRETTRFGWDDQNQGFKAAEAGRAANLGPLQLQQARENILNARDSRATNAVQRDAAIAATKLSKSSYETQQEQKVIDRAKAKMAGVLEGTTYADGIYNAKDIEGNFALMKMAGVGGGDLTKQRNVMEKLADIQNSGGVEIVTGTGKDAKTQKVPLSNAMVKAALAASSDPFFTAGWNRGPANSVEDIIKEMAKTTIDLPGADGSAVPTNKLLVDFQAYGSARRAAFPTPESATQPVNSAATVRALDNAIANGKKKP